MSKLSLLLPLWATPSVAAPLAADKAMQQIILDFERFDERAFRYAPA